MDVAGGIGLAGMRSNGWVEGNFGVLIEDPGAVTTARAKLVRSLLLVTSHVDPPPSWALQDTV